MIVNHSGKHPFRPKAFNFLFKNRCKPINNHQRYKKYPKSSGDIYSLYFTWQDRVCIPLTSDALNWIKLGSYCEHRRLRNIEIWHKNKKTLSLTKQGSTFFSRMLETHLKRLHIFSQDNKVPACFWVSQIKLGWQEDLISFWIWWMMMRFWKGDSMTWWWLDLALIAQGNSVWSIAVRRATFWRNAAELVQSFQAGLALASYTCPVVRHAVRAALVA